MSNTKRIRPMEDYESLADGDIGARAFAVETGMNGNPNFTNPPVALSDLKAARETLAELVSESLDGSKKVIAARKKQRQVVIKMLRLEGRYVEVMSKDDMAIFTSSGFPVRPSSRTPTQHLSETISKIGHGPNSGQIVARLKADRKAICYELRYGVAVNGAMPATWTVQTVTGAKTLVTVSGLAPGTTYAFSVRALRKSGWGDWGDSVMLMSI